MNVISSGSRGSKSVRDNTRDASIGSAEKRMNPTMNGDTYRRPVTDSGSRRRHRGGLGGGGTTATVGPPGVFNVLMSLPDPSSAGDEPVRRGGGSDAPGEGGAAQPPAK